MVSFCADLLINKIVKMCNFNEKVLFLQKNEPNSIIIYYNCSINLT